jgi:signal transduction histidine kinase
VQANNALIVPLFFQSRPVGAIGATRGEKPLNREQLALLHIFGENAAPILANARLYTAQLQQKELIESILASSPDPILVLDDQRRVVRSNLSAQEIFAELNAGTPDLGAIFRNVGIDAAMLREIDQILDAGQPFTREIGFGERYFNLLGAPLRLNEDAWVLEMNNISTLKELDALKTQMIRMASHDLKNPLGVVMGYTDLLLSGRAKDPERFLRMIDDAAKRMQAIITDILNIERLRAGRLDLAPIDIGDLLAETFEEYRPQAEEKAQTFTLQRPRYALITLLDKRQFKEAISNLIGNAIKYTPKEGAITVRLQENEGRLHIDVQDTGYGIPKDAQANLFKPFYRVRTKETASIPGTGLGLSLVKAVIEAHGGKIRLESDEGRGSTFHVELPMKLPEAVTE